MKDILDFCLEYWRELASIFCLIVSVVFYVIKRRPSYNLLDAIKEDILEVLPTLIREVEIDGNGQRKKQAVIQAIKVYVQKKYKIEFPAKILSFVELSIEDILSTPQKKGE